MTCVEYTTTSSAATPIKHEAAIGEIEGLATHFGLNMHAELPADQQEDFIRMAADSCVVNFIDTYGGAKNNKSEAV